MCSVCVCAQCACVWARASYGWVRALRIPSTVDAPFNAHVCVCVCACVLGVCECVLQMSESEHSTFRVRLTQRFMRMCVRVLGVCVCSVCACVCWRLLSPSTLHSKYSWRSVLCAWTQPLGVCVCVCSVCVYSVCVCVHQIAESEHSALRVRHLKACEY